MFTDENVSVLHSSSCDITANHQYIPSARHKPGICAASEGSGAKAGKADLASGQRGTIDVNRALCFEAKDKGKNKRAEAVKVSDQIAMVSVMSERRRCQTSGGGGGGVSPRWPAASRG